MLKPVGGFCDKHEILLEDGPEPAFGVGFDESERAELVHIATYGHPNECEAARIRLEAEGIRTFLEGERMGSNSIYQFAAGGVKLHVPASQAQDARVLLAQTWKPIVSDLEYDDAFEELAPDAASVRIGYFKAVVWLFLVAMSLIAAVTILRAVLLNVRPGG